MMNKKITPKAKAVYLLWALPVVALLLVAFAQPEYQKMTKEEQIKKLEIMLKDLTLKKTRILHYAINNIPLA